MDLIWADFSEIYQHIQMLVKVV